RVSRTNPCAFTASPPTIKYFASALFSALTIASSCALPCARLTRNSGDTPHFWLRESAQVRLTGAPSYLRSGDEVKVLKAAQAQGPELVPGDAQRGERPGHVWLPDIGRAVVIDRQGVAD